MNAVLPRTMQLARQQDRPDKVCGTMSQMAMVCWFEGRYAEGAAIAEAGLKMARLLNSLPLIFSNQLMLANLKHGMGEIEEAVGTARALCDMLTGELESARLGAPAIPSAMSHAFLSWFLLDAGDYEAACAHGERALLIALRDGDPYSEVLARHSYGRSLLLSNRNEDAVECLAIARALSEANGYDAIKPHATGSLCMALARTGRAGEAVGMAQACFESGLHLRTGRLEMYMLFAGYAEALFCIGEVERSLAIVDQAIELARRIRNPCLLVDGLGLSARLRMRARKPDPRADKDLAEAQDLCRRHGIALWCEPLNEAPGAKAPARPARTLA
jgi:tetratricopeptide (TPR) repeat protein